MKREVEGSFGLRAIIEQFVAREVEAYILTIANHIHVYLVSRFG
jgi:hypothetical protein